MRRSNPPSTPRLSRRVRRAWTVLRASPRRSASATTVARGSSPSACSSRASIGSTGSILLTPHRRRDRRGDHSAHRHPVHLRSPGPCRTLRAPIWDTRRPAMTSTRPAPAPLPGQVPEREALQAVKDRVLWLATAIVDHANRVRPNPGGLKVGGHQASSASIVTIMTSLWLEQLRAEDRVSVKPHASPVLHALEYLLGSLDRRYLTTLREFGGLQSYPSRLKDPVPADYSTGSVGIGATARIGGAIARRYVNTQLGAGGTGRQWSLVGDAELDEGAVWEA